MPAYCVQAQLIFNSATRRDQVRSDVESRIATRPRVDVDRIESVDLPERPFALLVELRFTSKLDQEDLRSRIEAFAVGPRAPQAGSWLRVHDCTHVDGLNLCGLTVTERRW